MTTSAKPRAFIWKLAALLMALALFAAACGSDDDSSSSDDAATDTEADEASEPEEEALLRIGSGPENLEQELDLLADLDNVLRDASICGLGQAASSAVQSALSIGLIARRR